MLKHYFTFFLLCCIIRCLSAQVVQPVDLVNPFVDTHKSRWFFFSSACRPFGMVNLSPDTDTNGSWMSGYLYGSPKAHAEAWKVSDNTIAGYEIMERTGRRPKDTPVYFYMQFSKPFEDIVMWKDSAIVRKTIHPERISGHNSGLAVHYKTTKNEIIRLKVDSTERLGTIAGSTMKTLPKAGCLNWNSEPNLIKSGEYNRLRASNK